MNAPSEKPEGIEAEIEALRDVVSELPSNKKEVGIFIERLHFCNGSTIDLDAGSIVVFVGPNNSGKSLSLKEIWNCIYEKNILGKSITKLDVQRVGDDIKIIEYLKPFKSKIDGYYRFGSSEHRAVNQRDVTNLWREGGSHLGEMANHFVSLLTTERRLADCLPADSFDAALLRNGSHPIHSLYLNTKLEEYISSLFAAAFGMELVLHRSGGRKIPIYVGKRPELEAGENEVSRSYLDKVEQLEKLEDQGDGFKSFASLLLRIWTGYHNILLIDEPEAFLHPPQARALGELISAGTGQQKQIFIATHSSDVIHGLLSKFSERVTIIRLQRSEAGSAPTFLPSSQISELWKDPILRYSSALNGLFHQNVVVTESDGDCRFYEAVAQSVAHSSDTTFYTYAGGKDRIPVIVRALRALHVPVKSIVDFDIFAQDHSIRNLIESHGHKWDDFQGDIKAIRDLVQSNKKWLLGSGLKFRINQAISNVDDNTAVQKNVLEHIRSILREASPWENVKSTGLASLPSGEPSKKAQSLLNRLQAAGIFVVPEGEMEGFCRTVGNHGPRWVEAVLTKDLSNDPELEGARKFVIKMIEPGIIGSAAQIQRLTINRKFSNKDYYERHTKTNLRITTFKNAIKTIGWALFVAFWGIQLAILINSKLSS